jgi:hypothetical protein
VLRAGDARDAADFAALVRFGAEETAGFVRLTDSGRVARVGVFVRSPTLGRLCFDRSGVFAVERGVGVRASTRTLSRVSGLLFGATVRVVRTGSIEGRRLTSCRAFSRVAGSRLSGASATVRVVRTGSIEGRRFTSCRAFSRVAGSRLSGASATVRVVRTGSIEGRVRLLSAAFMGGCQSSSILMARSR